MSEKVVAYSNAVVQLVSELERAGHNISEEEVKRTLLRSLIMKSDITAESMMSVELSHNGAVAKLIVRKTLD